jgi:hypothetical protein
MTSANVFGFWFVVGLKCNILIRHKGGTLAQEGQKFENHGVAPLSKFLLPITSRPEWTVL